MRYAVARGSRSAGAAGRRSERRRDRDEDDDERNDDRGERGDELAPAERADDPVALAACGSNPAGRVTQMAVLKLK